MNTYNVVIDIAMIRNILQTDMNESLDLLSIFQVLYFVLLGLLPAYLIYRANITYPSFKEAIITKVKMILLSLVIIGSSAYLFSKHYTSFVREHKPLRYGANPLYWIYSTGQYISLLNYNKNVVVKPIGMDAKIITDTKKGKIVIMIVGEAARADHFSLNGYEKETNPLLKTYDIVNFSNLYSCATSTAVSVPCMFSVYGRKDFTYTKGIETENILDVLNHTNKISILWRDNNSDSKGVALRVSYEYYKSDFNNKICTNGECRDEGMLRGLDTMIKTSEKENILIVLHQMGNHGPAYYKRYPKAYEKFTPVCKTNQLEACTKEEISNAYDNAILYTDYFLSKVIEFLKPFESTHDTAMVYMSDHGESLGEKGLYLHGMPYFMAPDAQKHVPALMWLSQGFREKIGNNTLSINKTKTYSHDNLFHTLLGLFNVKTKVYNQEMDMLYGTK